MGDRTEVKVRIAPLGQPDEWEWSITDPDSPLYTQFASGRTDTREEAEERVKSALVGIRKSFESKRRLKAKTVEYTVEV